MGEETNPRLVDTEAATLESASQKKTMGEYARIMNKRALFILLSVLVTALMVFISLIPLHLPAAQPASLPADQFSASRAMRTIAHIAQEPHPAGSAAQSAVREYILTELKTLGLSPEVMHDIAYPFDGSAAITVDHLTALIKGKESTGTVLVLAHYDSTPFGPGAGDNGTGAAALLEVARNLASGVPLKNDVILLFDDGEESVYPASYAFDNLEKYPWLNEVKFVLSLDTAARGPVTLLDSSPNNSRLMQAFAEANPAPVAYSFFSWMDSVTGDTSDYTFFGQHGIPGMAIEDPTAFSEKHSPDDILDKVIPGSLQQMGDQTLALTRRFADLDLPSLGGVRSVYFTLPGKMIVYEQRLAIGLAILGLAMFAGGVALGRRAQRLTWRGMGLGALAFLASLLLSGLSAVLLSQLLHNRLSVPGVRVTNSHPPGSLIYLLLFLAVALVVWLAVNALAIRHTALPNLAFGALLTWVLLMMITSLLAPEASAMFTWPVLVSLIAWAIIFACRLGEESLGFLAAGWAASFASLLIWVPVIGLGYIGTAFQTIPLLVVLTAWMLGGLLPQMSVIVRKTGSKPGQTAAM